MFLICGPTVSDRRIPLIFFSRPKGNGPDKLPMQHLTSKRDTERDTGRERDRERERHRERETQRERI